jgi:hypothetical protein
VLPVSKRKVYDSAGKKPANREYEEVKPKRAKQDRSDKQYLKWWTDSAGKDAASTLFAWVDRQRSVWSSDAIGDLVAESIYSDTPVSSAGRLNANGRYAGTGGGMNPLNKIKALVDTGTARLTKVRSMPVISADDATYQEKRFAREQSRVLRRKMGNGDMETVAPELIRDFIIRGTAFGKVSRCYGDTEFERVPAYEIVYDHREALHAKKWEDLSTLAHVRPESRDKLIAEYPEQADLIKAAPPFKRLDPWMTYTYVGPELADMVEVAEAWRLPQGKTKGQVIMCLRNGTFCRRPRKASHYPVVAMYWTAPTRGVGRGTGLVYEQAAAQEWINDILASAREAIYAGSQLKVFQPKQGGANKHHLKTRNVAVIEHDGVEPHYVAPDPVSKQAWAIAFQMAEQMEVTSGISAWASQAKNPLGAGASGKALDTMDDQQSDRFAHVESGYQQGRVAIGLRHVEEAREMHDEASGESRAKVYDEQPKPLKKDDLAAWIRENAWPDVDIDGGDYHLTLEPENFLVGTRGDRIAQVNELAKAGLIPDPSLTASMIDEPDIQRANRGILGPTRRIEQCLSDLANPKVPYIDCAPDPEMLRPLAKLLALGELEQAKADKADEEICQRFRDFIADLKRLDDLAAQGAPSLAGAQQNNIVAQQNAGDLMGGGGGPPAPGGAPTGAPPPGAPPMLPPGVS